MVLFLGPIAVHPTYQGEGLGAALIRTSIKRAQELNWRRVLMVGDEVYYRRFGFRKIDGIIFPPPTNPDRILGIELDELAWEGVLGEVFPLATKK
jgi:predicted N-acetyltransferase YhbS